MPYVTVQVMEKGAEKSGKLDSLTEISPLTVCFTFKGNVLLMIVTYTCNCYYEKTKN